MKKIVSNILIVSAQLLVGGLFLLTLFSNNDADNSVVVVRNNNLDKMADSVSYLFVDSLAQAKKVNDSTVEEIRTAEEAEKARLEAEAKAKAEAEAKAKAEAEAKAKAEAEAKARAEQAASSVQTSGGYKTYTLSDSDFAIVAGVVACEAVGYDDALGVCNKVKNLIKHYMLSQQQTKISGKLASAARSAMNSGVP